MEKHLSNGRNATRSRLIVLLSVRAGLRAKEIAHVTWRMVLNSDGTLSDEIALNDCASKGESGRVVPMSKDLKVAMGLWRKECGVVDHRGRIVTTERAKQTSAQAMTCPPVVPRS